MLCIAAVIPFWVYFVCRLVGRDIDLNVPEGSVTISVGCCRLSTGKMRLDFSVTDTGIGVPADQCSEVFKPLVQADDVARGRRGGTGLGLAICQRLVQAMGGSISLVNAMGEGTCVSFCLEVETAQNLPVVGFPQDDFYPRQQFS